MEEQEKAYNAFWCMYEATLKGENGFGLSPSSGNDTIQIYNSTSHLTTKGMIGLTQVVAYIKVRTDTRLVEEKKRFFGRNERTYAPYEVIEGMVMNLKENESFDFCLSDPELVEKTREMITTAHEKIQAESVKAILKAKEVRDARRILALEELQCKKG